MKANSLLQTQIDSQDTKDKLKDESSNVNQLYNTFKYSIDNFRFGSLETKNFGKGHYTIGSEAIYSLFQSFYCNYHGDDDTMKQNPKITELISVLELCSSILDMLKGSTIPDRQVIRTLTVHQFHYRIMPKLNEIGESWEKHHCDGCNKEHGLPERIIQLVRKITADSEVN